MAIQQSKSRRKITGGRYKEYRKKRLHELGSDPTLTKIAEKRLVKKRIRGSHYKISLLSTNIANVYDPKEKNIIKQIL